MNALLRNILAVIIGIIVGGLVNMGLIIVSGDVIPLPEGIDQTSYESLAASMHLMQPKHFIFPFLAHALGTLVGAFVAVKIGVSSHMRLALIVGLFFLLGGLTNVKLIPAPVWFCIVDILFAYIPMAWLAYIYGAPQKS